VLGEIVASGLGAGRFISERLKPYLKRQFPELRPDGFTIAPDPAANNRSANDESTILATMKRHFPCSIETNNRLPLRLEAIDHFATGLAFGMPKLVIDDRACPQLVRALKGGWRYKLDAKEQIKGGGNAMPEKNAHSHVGDGFGYLCRYFHRGTLKAERNGGSGGRGFVPPRTFGGGYHFR